MQIIHKGSNDNIGKIRLECPNCLTDFIASESEYNVDYEKDAFGRHINCKCPVCTSTIKAEIKRAREDYLEYVKHSPFYYYGISDENEESEG